MVENTQPMKPSMKGLKQFYLLRPLQFNYLSYKLFLEKKSCQTPKKKKKKKSPLVFYGRKWF